MFYTVKKNLLNVLSKFLVLIIVIPTLFIIISHTHTLTHDSEMLQNYETRGVPLTKVRRAGNFNYVCF